MPIPKRDNLGQNVQSVPVIASLPIISFVENLGGASRWSTLDALRAIFQNAVPHSLIQRTSPAPTPDASRRYSIRDIEIPSCLLRRVDRRGYV
jgi:hypothetical protein